MRYVFRDIDNMPGGGLSERICDALDRSQKLIIICSLRAAAEPEWVDKEINYFKKNKGIYQIFPFIIDGVPHDKDKECFPPALRSIKPERVAININEKIDGEIEAIKREIAEQEQQK